MYQLKRSQTQIDEQIDWASEYENEGETAVPGMTYEQGVQAALRWLIGEEDGKPIETRLETE